MRKCNWSVLVFFYCLLVAWMCCLPRRFLAEHVYFRGSHAYMLALWWWSRGRNHLFGHISGGLVVLHEGNGDGVPTNWYVLIWLRGWRYEVLVVSFATFRMPISYVFPIFVAQTNVCYVSLYTTKNYTKFALRKTSIVFLLSVYSRYSWYPRKFQKSSITRDDMLLVMAL